MAMVIANNINAIFTKNRLNVNNNELGKSLEKLSSGYRINSGSDDPAGLVISEQLRSQISGLERAVQNTAEASNVIGIAEGALNEVNNILKSMRSLALHAANSGVTSPQQVAADQAEADSAIQTIDRIANTTRYSDQFLLNGNKGISYGRNTLIKGTQQKSILDVNFSSIDQILKTDFDISMAYGGVQAAATGTSINTTRGDGVADVSKEARKAYFEIDPGGTNTDVDSTGQLTAAQQFTLTGSKGSRSFSFNTGATVGQIASAINNAASSTGVNAQLIFNSDQTVGVLEVASSRQDGRWAASINDQIIFNQTHADANQTVTNGVTNMNSAVNGAVTGLNTDGEGRLWIKYTSDTAYELYKSSDFSEESLVASGTSGNTIVAQNNSGLDSLELVVANGLSASKSSYIATRALTSVATQGVTQTGNLVSGAAVNTYQSGPTVISGVNLGQNTDAEGKIYIKTTMTGVNTGTVKAYRDAQMREEDLVAQTDNAISLLGLVNQTVYLDEVQNADGTAGSGLGIALSLVLDFASTAGTEHTGEISFTQLGVRISSDEYGSRESITVQQQQGSLWQYYEEADNSGATVVNAGETVQVNGQDATINVNGSDLQTDGLTLELATTDVQGTLVFDEGEIGNTTIAQVGYTTGSAFSKATFLTNISYNNANVENGTYGHGSFLVNAGHKTTENLNDFQGGMQFQLGEGAGDQERTIYSIKSMTASQLGRVEFTEQFEDGIAVQETKTLNIQDILGGGLASLGVDPTRALSIIDQAISDVSNLRASLGAFQANTLTTNENSLNVAIENITKTESGIRDADMAYETTQFTKNQILVSAATSMLAQANAAQQQVLQLLG